MSIGKVIAITGPAAAGKSTVAHALQVALCADGDLWVVMELDVFARGLSREWIGMGKRRGRFAERGFIYARSGADGIRLTLGPDARRFLNAFHCAVGAMAAAGTSVVCETIVYDSEDWHDWADSLAGIDTRWVRLAAPIDVLEERENAEPTRIFKGLARGMLARAPVGAFDVEADTSVEAIDAIVQRVVAMLRSS